jgi:hypothetical protein
MKAQRPPVAFEIQTKYDLGLAVAENLAKIERVMRPIEMSAR